MKLTLLQISFLLFLNSFFVGCSLERRPNSRPAREVVTIFYQDYMNRIPRRPQNMKYSDELQKLFDEYESICKIKSEKDKCSWNFDRDIYLDTHAVDPKLDFKNSQFLVNENEPGIVDVEFKIYKTLHRVRFHMIRADGDWVVDDIFYSDKSTRQRLKEEVRYYYLYK
ncbi:MAG: hypothetical protein A4S09_13390 [Proteobacteria bacterium SG_bin7]|nr:MAG: hypothetical protein A4S09_13390 [Proteobacteria bacterium SG_bin7]